MTRNALTIFGALFLLLGSSHSNHSSVGARLPNLLRLGRLLNAPALDPQPRKGWVIYVFSPGSALSAANSTRVEGLAGSLPPEDWAFLAVATTAEGLVPFVERQHVTVPVLAQVSPEALDKYSTSGSPRTFILDQDWKLIEALDGPYQRAVAKKLEQRFKVRWQAGPVKAPKGKPGPEARQEGDRRLCLDRQQRDYSHGADVELLGAKFRCGTGGFWFPVG